ncbi:MAG: translation initiation factor [Acidobacteriota bacterium]|nr:translation initiation factor [Acidobacteriota bacterium]
MMGISNQDLVFKLKSIGVRVESDDAAIDTDIIQAILAGKKLPHPREVILRDEQSPAAVDQTRRRAGGAPAPPPTAARRPLTNQMRPQRPRTLIQKVEPNIRELPVTERQMGVSPSALATASPGIEAPAPLHQGQAQPSAAEPELALQQEAVSGVPAEATAVQPEMVPKPAAPPAQASPPTARPSQPGQPPRTGSRIISTPGQPGHIPARTSPPPRPGAPSQPRRDAPAQGRPAYGASSYGAASGSPANRPSGPSSPPGRGVGASAPPSRGPAPAAPSGGDDRRRDSRDKNRKPIKKAGPRPVEQEEDLTGFKGTLEELEEEVNQGSAGASRRKRRILARNEDEGGKLLTFKKAAPAGPVMIGEGMTVREFAEKLGVKSRDLMSALFKRGILANINQVLDTELAQKLATDLGVEAMVVSFEEEVQLREEQHGSEQPENPSKVGKVVRAPVVTIMGHVDHGKTSLLDAIRSAKVTESEAGGITQHIGAYQAEVNGRKVVFLDTPGHEAFTMMRARGARVTDIVVLVVAADDGVMPQTIEAIDHAKAAKVPLIVAINKIDKANANQDRVKRELSERGLMPEDWGGDTVMVPVSAIKKDGISDLLEMILLTSDILELKASPEIAAQGAVLEARKEVGRGIVSTVLVQNGTLKVGDIFVSGATWGRVRSMSDDKGKRIKEAGPATPVEVTGFNELPDAGDLMQVVEDESKARGIAEYRQQEQRSRDLAPGQGRLSLEQLFSRIQEGDVKDLAVVVKADVQGSLEVLREAVTKESTEKVKVQVLHAGIGAITTNDVLLASASKAIIIGFNVRPERSAVELAEKEEIDIRLHTVIYELIDELKKAMTGLLDPTFREVTAGRAEVRDTFKVPKIGTIAGCHVVEGVIPRTAGVRLLRDNRVIYEGKIASLRRFKDDASEVRSGFDCGIGLEKFQDFKPGDFIEAYTREEVAPVL